VQTLSPTFPSNTTNYTVNVGSDVTSINVSATKDDPNAVTSDDVTAAAGTATGQATIQLGVPGTTTPVLINVTAPNGSSKTYRINVIKAPLGSNNNLSALSVSVGTAAQTLSPTFPSNTTNYTVNVGSDVTSINVSATKDDPNAVMSDDVTAAAGTATGQATIQLGVPGTTTPVLINVTAPNGSSKTYRINVIKAPLGSNNNLSALSVSVGTAAQTLSPTFPSNTTNYTVNVGSDVTSVNVSATKDDPNAVTSDDVTAAAGTATGQATIQLGVPGTTTPVLINVTAPNGSSKTYRINVIKAPLGSNNNLSALSVSVGTAAQTLSPTFPSNTTNYTVNVGSDVTSVNVSATKDDPNAVMSDDVTAAAGTATGQATIQLGVPGTTTPVLINVTAPNGSSKTYRINVIKAPLGSNNNLSALSVNVGTAAQTLSPTFDPSTTAYTVNVTSNVTEVTVSATKDDPNAVMAIGSVTVSAGTALGQASILLTGPSTSVSIMVTAQNGVNAQTYNISVNQGPSAPASAPDLIPHDDSGVLPGQDADNNPNVNTPRFRITQPGGGETPSLYVDGGKVESLFNSETNTLRPTAALSDGQHTITSTVANGGGESSPSPPLTVTIDTIAPEFP